ncbi:MAG TPA: TetR/AcrR family transcriptional regulator [Candidatus Acidoferrum sp.]|jgi:AcrR family transcriptional regulator|nr:TetR/AcrR family transcriptional regulator [Candidatus Acidoferrum sp.]
MLHQDCERLDPRIRRTRQLLQDALKRLLEQNEFDKITIQDITEAATLNRATFYAHYPDKFALLEELIRVSFLQLLECRKVRFDGSCATAFYPIILAVCDYLAELQKSQSSSQHQFEPFVERTVIDQIRAILMDGFQRHPMERNIPSEMIAATASWAIYGATKQWVNTPEHGPAEEFVATASNLVQPILMAGIVSVAAH